MCCCQPGAVLTSHGMAEKRFAKTCHCLFSFWVSASPIASSVGRSAELGADGVFILCLHCSSPSGSLHFRVCIKMKRLFLVQQPAAAVRCLLHTCPVLRPLVVAAVSVCLPDVFPAHGPGPLPRQPQDPVLSQQGLVIPTGCQGAAGVWVRRRVWCSPGVTQRLCLARAFGKESMVKPLKTFAYSTKCCCNLVPCP